jgi:HlyD family secretion protein
MSVAMDRPLPQPSVPRRWLILGAAGVALLLLVASLILGKAERSVRLPLASVSTATVAAAVYHDFIPLRGTVVPHDTVYLDALEGGRVERVLVQAGDQVTIGQPLVELSNTELELDVLDREGRLVESITELQTYEMQLEQTRLNNAKDLATIDYNITRLARSLARRQPLAAHGFASIEEKEGVQDELDYNRRVRPVQAESNAQQETLRTQQLPQIHSELENLQRDLAITRGKLDNLVVRAPVTGRVTSLDLKVGEHRNRGERLAEVTADTGYKLSADIDEFYLDRVHAAQSANVQVGDKAWALHVDRIYPKVKDGRFKVDFAFTGAQPEGLLPGEAVQGKLALGDDSRGIILPAGAFQERTGGDWVFVLSPDGQSATRRRIKVGRRNSDQLEILSGLQPGERVITSDYAGLEGVDRVDLTR